MILLVLGEWWAALGGIEKVFWGISIVFSVLFFIQFVLSLVGLDFETDTEFESNYDSGFSPDASFTILSVRSFIAFFTFFGWTGVSVIGNGGSNLWAVGLGTLAGFSAMLLVGYIMFLFARLQDDGSVFNAYEAIDEIGTVYLRIPPMQQGVGKVQIKLQGSLKEVDAVTRDDEQIPTGASIKVIDVIDEKILVVEAIDKYLKTGI